MKRAAIIVKPKQPYIDWANTLDDHGPKLGQGSVPKHTIYSLVVIKRGLAEGGEERITYRPNLRRKAGRRSLFKLTRAGS